MGAPGDREEPGARVVIAAGLKEPQRQRGDLVQPLSPIIHHSLVRWSVPRACSVATRMRLPDSPERTHPAY
jgi:hypothetical protein